ncbi:MAG: menaquinone biosynthesis protein [Vicinamibacterales bacterium]
MSLTRLGAVAYLNARPLTYGLELKNADFALRFDAPSKCASLLHEHAVDLGMIPSVEFLRGHEAYRIVPNLGITSNGPVASVALFCRTPLSAVRTIAADTSSRTSNALLRILCVERFGLDPEFVPMAPDATAMLYRCDAALIIGDPALFLDPEAQEVRKVDLGEEWTAMTGLPFVWAFWAGRPDALTPARLTMLQDARTAGVSSSDRIADEYCGAERSALCRGYLKDNIHYVLGEPEQAGLRRFYELAIAHELVEGTRPIAFF